MAGSYIPATDSGFDDFAVNFADLLTADPSAYGEDAGVASTVQSAVDDWHAAYLLATNPNTRTTPVIADKDAARVVAAATIRPVAQRINSNTSVTNQQREDLGLTVRKEFPTPVPAPTSAPTLALLQSIPNQQKLSIRDENTPTSKAKPFGVVGVEVFRAVGEAAVMDPSEASLLARSTVTPVYLGNASGDAGMTATYFARWTTRSGPNGIAQVGPWSAPLVTILQ